MSKASERLRKLCEEIAWWHEDFAAHLDACTSGKYGCDWAGHGEKCRSGYSTAMKYYPREMKKALAKVEQGAEL